MSEVPAEAGGVFGGGAPPPLKTRVRVDIREEAHLLPRELDPEEVSLSFSLFPSFFLSSSCSSSLLSSLRLSDTKICAP